MEISLKSARYFRLNLRFLHNLHDNRLVERCDQEHIKIFAKVRLVIPLNFSLFLPNDSPNGLHFLI